MANDTNITMGMYGDKLRLFGLGGGVFDTQALLDATVASMELKNVPYKNQLAKYEEELKSWNNLKLQMETLDKTVTDLKNLTIQDKKVTNNMESSFNFTANSRALETNYSVKVEQLATAHKVRSEVIDNHMEPLNMNGTFKINGKEIEIDSSMNLNDIARKINSVEDVGVNSVVVGGSLIFTSTKTGLENSISFEDSELMEDGDTILNKLGIFKQNLNNETVLNEVQAAKNSIVVIDGVTIERSTNKINDAIEGVNLELKTVTNGNANVVIDQNNDLIKEKTEKFVNDFNTIIRYLNSISGEEGALQGKNIPIKAKNDMISALNSKLDGLKAFDIGISIDGVMKNGTVTFDVEKLMNKLNSDPEGVMNLLTGAGSITDNLSKKLNNTFNAATGTITTTIDGINKRIRNTENTISKNELSFAKQQETLLKQFAAYESTMSGLNQQLTYMKSQIESWNNSGDD